MFAVLYAGLGDFVPLYSVYALLFAAEGMSPTSISSLFVIWSVVAFVAEVPSGAWADLVSRRLLLAIGSLLTAAGFALWLLVPTYAGFAAGFVLWGLGGAMASGTWESLVYDALAERGASQRYAGVIGGCESAGWVAAVVSAALTAPLLEAGGHVVVGWVSVAVAVAHGVHALWLPDPLRTGVDPEEAEAGDYVSMLVAGLREAARHPPVRRAVMIVALLLGLLAFDEYLPLVARASGYAEVTIPLLMAATFAAQAGASALAGRAARLSDRRRAQLLAAAGVLIGGGALSGTPAGFALVVAGYAMANCMMIVAGACLQDAITGRARSTVTSTVGLGSEVVAVALFMGYAGGSLFTRVGLLVALNAVPLVAVAAWSRHGHRRVRVHPSSARS